MNSIEQLVDRCLRKMEKEEYLMKTIGRIPSIMIDSSKPTSNDWISWKPALSEIGDVDILEFEELFKCKLPTSYKKFLRYKYLIELDITDHAVKLHSNLPDPGLNKWATSINEFESSQELVEKGFVHFAEFNDYGLLCFNCNEMENDECPIVFVDHEEIETIHFYTSSFLQLLANDQDFGNRFIVKLNEFNKNK